MLNVLTYYNTSTVQIAESTFEFNKALRVSDIGGGALCIMNTTALISNSSFIGNAAEGFGGVMVSHDSMVIINNTLFYSNMAGGDGGALATYAFPIVITSSLTVFSHTTKLEMMEEHYL